MSRRLLAARALTIVFLAAGWWHLLQASRQDNLIFYADAALYLGLAVLWNAIAREENRK
jgi:hypothetical protein